MAVLAQNSDASDLFLPTLIIMVVIALLIGSIAVIRKRMLAADEVESDPMAGLSLSNLRQLVKQGKMTQEEFDAAKNQLVARTQRASEKAKPVENAAPDTKIDPDSPI